MARKSNRRLWHAFLLVLGWSLFVYLAVQTGAAEIARLLLRIGWYLAPIVAIYLAYELTRAFAYLKCVGASCPCPYWDLVKFRLSGEAVQFLTGTGPFLAEPAKMWLLRRQGLSTVRAVAATVSEFLMYTFTSAMLAIAGLTCLLRNFQLAHPMAVTAKVVLWVMGIFLTIAAGAILGHVYLIGAVIKGIKALPWIGSRVALKDQEVRETEDLLFVVLRSRPVRFLSILAIEFAAQALLLLEVLVLLHAIGEALSFRTPLVIEGATKFIGLAFFFIPGQVGATEGVYTLLFKTVGLAASAGFALAVARRLRSLIAVGLGLALAAGSRYSDS